MRVTSLRVQNFRSFVDSGVVELGNITILTGRNNAGKSNLVQALLWMQEFQHSTPLGTHVRAGAAEAKVTVTLSGVEDVPRFSHPGLGDDVWLSMSLTRSMTAPTLVASSEEDTEAGSPVAQISGTAPNHFIVPFLARRKVTTFQSDVTRDRMLQVGPDLSYLATKLNRVLDPGFSRRQIYADTCKELVGYVVAAVATQHGQLPGVYVDDGQTEAIYIDAMGDGVPHIVALLADLVLARNKLFVIEEPETDLHPRALKALLYAIVNAAETNQFVVSTHSNIVLRHLGAEPGSIVQYVQADTSTRVPVASVRKVERDPFERMSILRELGYELYDFDLWDAWLIMEEASGERLVRDHLIPWFVPGLGGRVRTLSTRGNKNVEATFEDFNRLVLFTHLEPAYRNRAWVLIDGDDEGQTIVHSLQQKYRDWDASRFSLLSESSFEMYYPPRFAKDAAAALDIQNRREKQRAKHELLESVRAWIAEDPDTARAELEQSAAPVIARLREIESSLYAKRDS